jgi:hypothetical protein
MIFELIGLRFAPRIRDPPPRPLHCTDPRCRRNPRSCSSKSPGRADHAMPRRAAARRGLLRYGCAPARMLMPVRRPSASRNLLAPAPQEYGRLVKMNFIITGWLGDKQPPSESAASSIAALTRASGSTTTRARSPGLRACEGVNQRQPIPGIRRAAWPQALDPSVQSCAAAYGLRTRDQGAAPAAAHQSPPAGPTGLAAGTAPGGHQGVPRVCPLCRVAIDVGLRNSADGTCDVIAAS